MKQIWNRYHLLFAFVSAIAIFLATWQLSIPLGRTALFLFYVLLVTLNAWYGGRRLGSIAIISSVLSASYFILFVYQSSFPNRLVSAYDISMYSLVSVLITIIIDRYKRFDIVDEYKKKLTDHRNALIRLSRENAKMHEEIKLRDEFLSIASHELKTPLTSMLLKIQSALHNVRSVSLANFSVENLLKMLETAESQTQRLSRMINDLLNVSLITTGKMNLELEKADLSKIVKEVVDEFAERLEKRSYIVKQGLDEEVICSIDKLRIEQVISNLLSNAIKYGEGKPIEVKVKKKNSTAIIEVKDHGIGIDPSEKKKIFELFERAVNYEQYKGLGVGLYIANQIVQEHGGKIKVQSWPKMGAVFTVELPIK